MQKFERWSAFCALTGQYDAYISDLSPREKLTFVCAWAAWAREGDRWSGHTCIQALSAIRTLFIQHLADHSVFDTDTVKQLRRSLSLTDYFAEASANKEDRLPFGLDMVRTAAERSLASQDMSIVMLGTAITLAFLLLLRVGEYGEAPTNGSPDHRLMSNNVAFYIIGVQTPLTPSQLRAYSSTITTPIILQVRSVSITLAGSKTDKKRNGVTFSFERDDFDMDDDTNAIAMLTRWACLVHQRDTDPFFSFRRDTGGDRCDLSAQTITAELRSVALIHHFKESDLYRFTPHSIRRGMATHLHNLGITMTVILQMGRWSPRSTAAPRYQLLGRGACSQVAATTRKANERSQTSEDTRKSLTHVANFRAQYAANNDDNKKM